MYYVPIKSLAHHFVEDGVITVDEEKGVLLATTQSEAANYIK